jgi:hypothetical protein
MNAAGGEQECACALTNIIVSSSQQVAHGVLLNDLQEDEGREREEEKQRGGSRVS